MTHIAFPNRVWEQTPDGRWASRPLTMKDTLQRNEVQKQLSVHLRKPKLSRN